jgi:dihydrofolate reductase
MTTPRDLGIQRVVVVACGLGGEIGSGGGLMWDLPLDLKNFRTITHRGAVLIGRLTAEDIARRLGGALLPGRLNLVLTRSGWPVPDMPNAKGTAVCSVGEGLNAAVTAGHSDCFIIGGEHIYRSTLAFANEIYLTRVLARFPEADSWFPLSMVDDPDSGWKRISLIEHSADA